MMKFTFFRVRKPRQFEYKPLYYDPEQEAKEERKKAVLGENYQDKYKTPGELAKEAGEYKPGQYLRGMNMRRGLIVDKNKSERRKRNSTRFIILLVLLGILFFWLLS